MFPKSLLLAACCTVVTAASAQFALDFSAGVGRSTTSVNLSEDISNVIFPDHGWYTSFFAGVAPSYGLSERFRVLLTAQYSLKGYTFADRSAGQDVKVKLGYVELIPEAEWRPIPALGLGVGPYLAFNVLEQVGSLRANSFDIVHAVDFGAVASARVYYKDFFAVVRYAHGFPNINKIPFTNENGQLVDDANHRLRNAQVGIGYRLSFAKASL